MTNDQDLDQSSNEQPARAGLKHYLTLAGLVVVALVVGGFILSGLQPKRNYAAVHWPRQTASFEGADFVFDLTTQLLDTEKPEAALREHDDFRFDLTASSPQGEFSEAGKTVMTKYFPVVVMVDDRQQRVLRPTPIKAEPVESDGKVTAFKGSRTIDCPLHFIEPAGWQLKWMAKSESGD